MVHHGAAGIAQTPRRAHFRSNARAALSIPKKASSHSFTLSAFCEGSLTTTHCLYTAHVPRIATHHMLFTTTVRLSVSRRLGSY